MTTAENEISRLVALGYRVIAVLGNDPSIDDIDFQALRGAGAIIAGVNRIWHKVEPDFLLFLDTEIQQELRGHARMERTKLIVSSEYVNATAQRFPLNINQLRDQFERVTNIPNIPRQFGLFGSVTTLIHVLNEIIFNDRKNVFLVCGVSLKIDDINSSHFWKIAGTHTLNTQNLEWYEKRFEQQIESFQKLKSYCRHMYNCTPSSRLVDIMDHVDLNVISKKNETKKQINRIMRLGAPTPDVRSISSEPPGSTCINKIKSRTGAKVVHFAVPTYNRPDDLLRLLRDIQHEKDYAVDVYVYDDCSDVSYARVLEFMDSNRMSYQYRRFDANNGKKGYANVYNQIFADAKRSRFHYFVQSADDMRLVDRFFERATQAINSIQKDVLNILLTSHHVRLGRKPETVNGVLVYKNSVDGAYIAKRQFFEKIGYSIDMVDQKRWDKDDTRGSGTGYIIASKYGEQIYQLAESLFIHRGHDSVMNPVLRRIEKMESVVTGSKDVETNEMEKLQFFKRQVFGRRVVLVGPSPTIAENGTGFGAVIDGYDLVVRTNGAVPVPTEMSNVLGTRTDVLLINNAFAGTPGFDIRRYDGTDVRFIFHFGRLADRKSKKLLVQFGPEILKRICVRLGVLEAQPFGGMYLIEQLLDCQPSELMVCGFSNYQGQQAHYPGYLPPHIGQDQVMERQKRFHRNTGEHQREYISGLLSSGRIRMDEESKKHFT